jgi:hypothetical protein
MRLVSIELFWQAQCFFIDQLDALYQVKVESDDASACRSSKPSNIKNRVCHVALFLV